MIVEPSPFPHQGPLEPDQVRGRDDLVADVIERLTGRRVTALVGPRRFGKTSLLRRVAAEVEAGGASVVWVDLYEATSVADLARRFDSALAEARGPVEGPLAALAARFDLQLGLLGVQLSRRRDERPDAEASLDALLDTLVAGSREAPTVVVIDEFPGIDRVEGAAGLLRTKLQHHVQEVGLVFAGSQPSLMRAMFVDRQRPFYAQADLVEIGPFSASAVDEIVVEGFESTGRRAGDLPGLIHAFASGHPHRTMQLADAAWRAVPSGEGPTSTTWADTLERLRGETNLACEAVFSGLTTGEKATLRLLAHADALFGVQAETLGLSAGSARHALDALVDAGDVVKGTHRPRVVDPVLADWIRRRFPR